MKKQSNNLLKETEKLLAPSSTSVEESLSLLAPCANAVLGCNTPCFDSQKIFSGQILQQGNWYQTMDILPAPGIALESSLLPIWDVNYKHHPITRTKWCAANTFQDITDGSELGNPQQSRLLGRARVFSVQKRSWYQHFNWSALNKVYQQYIAPGLAAAEVVTTTLNELTAYNDVSLSGNFSALSWQFSRDYSINAYLTAATNAPIAASILLSCSALGGLAAKVQETQWQQLPANYAEDVLLCQQLSPVAQEYLLADSKALQDFAKNSFDVLQQVSYPIYVLQEVQDFLVSAARTIGDFPTKMGDRFRDVLEGKIIENSPSSTAHKNHPPSAATALKNAEFQDKAKLSLPAFSTARPSFYVSDFPFILRDQRSLFASYTYIIRSEDLKIPPAILNEFSRLNNHPGSYDGFLSTQDFIKHNPKRESKDSLISTLSSGRVLGGMGLIYTFANQETLTLAVTDTSIFLSFGSQFGRSIFTAVGSLTGATTVLLGLFVVGWHYIQESKKRKQWHKIRNALRETNLQISLLKEKITELEGSGKDPAQLSQKTAELLIDFRQQHALEEKRGRSAGKRGFWRARDSHNLNSQLCQRKIEDLLRLQQALELQAIASAFITAHSHKSDVELLALGRVLTNKESFSAADCVQLEALRQLIVHKVFAQAGNGALNAAQVLLDAAKNLRYYQADIIPTFSINGTEYINEDLQKEIKDINNQISAINNLAASGQNPYHALSILISKTESLIMEWQHRSHHRGRHRQSSHHVSKLSWQARIEALVHLKELLMQQREAGVVLYQSRDLQLAPLTQVMQELQAQEANSAAYWLSQLEALAKAEDSCVSEEGKLRMIITFCFIISKAESAARLGYNREAAAILHGLSALDSAANLQQVIEDYQFAHNSQIIQLFLKPLQIALQQQLHSRRNLPWQSILGYCLDIMAAVQIVAPNFLAVALQTMITPLPIVERHFYRMLAECGSDLHPHSLWNCSAQSFFSYGQLFHMALSYLPISALRNYIPAQDYFTAEIVRRQLLQWSSGLLQAATTLNAFYQLPVQSVYQPLHWTTAADSIFACLSWGYEQYCAAKGEASVEPSYYLLHGIVKGGLLTLGSTLVAKRLQGGFGTLAWSTMLTLGGLHLQQVFSQKTEEARYCALFAAAVNNIDYFYNIDNALAYAENAHYIVLDRLPNSEENKAVQSRQKIILSKTEKRMVLHHYDFLSGVSVQKEITSALPLQWQFSEDGSMSNQLVSSIRTWFIEKIIAAPVVNDYLNGCEYYYSLTPPSDKDRRHIAAGFALWFSRDQNKDYIHYKNIHGHYCQEEVSFPEVNTLVPGRIYLENSCYETLRRFSRHYVLKSYADYNRQKISEFLQNERFGWCYNAEQMPEANRARLSFLYYFIRDCLAAKNYEKIIKLSELYYQGETANVNENMQMPAHLGWQILYFRLWALSESALDLHDFHQHYQQCASAIFLSAKTDVQWLAHNYKIVTEHLEQMAGKGILALVNAAEKTKDAAEKIKFLTQVKQKYSYCREWWQLFTDEHSKLRTAILFAEIGDVSACKDLIAATENIDALCTDTIGEECLQKILTTLAEHAPEKFASLFGHALRKGLLKDGLFIIAGLWPLAKEQSAWVSELLTACSDFSGKATIEAYLFLIKEDVSSCLQTLHHEKQASPYYWLILTTVLNKILSVMKPGATQYQEGMQLLLFCRQQQDSKANPDFVYRVQSWSRQLLPVDKNNSLKGQTLIATFFDHQRKNNRIPQNNQGHYSKFQAN